MADERATITVQLVDEASAGLDQLAEKFEGLRKSVAQFYEEADTRQRKYKEGSEQVSQGNERARQSTSRLGEAFRNLGGFARNAFLEIGTGLAGMQRNLTGVERGMQATTQAAATMATSFRGVAGTIGLITGAAAVATGGLYFLARSIINAQQEAINLRRSLGEVNDRFILTGQRVGQNFGEALDRTRARMKAFADQFFELHKGTAAALTQNLSAFGPAGESMARQLQRAMESGMGAEQARQDIFLPWYTKQKEFTRRRIAARTGLIFEELEAERDAYRKGEFKTPPWMPSPEQKAEMDKQIARLREHFNNIRNILSDNVNQAWYPYKQKVVAGLADLFEYLDKELPKALDNLGRKWKETFGVEFDPMKGFKNALKQFVEKDLPALLDEIKLLIEGRYRELWSRIFSWKVPDWLKPVIDKYNERQNVPPVSPEEQERNDRLRRKFNPRRGGTPQRFSDTQVNPLGLQDNGQTFDINSLSGGLSTNIDDRRMVDNSDQAVDYLRDIRDVLLWQRQQQEGTGAGGTASGGGPPGGGGGPPAGGGSGPPGQAPQQGGVDQTNPQQQPQDGQQQQAGGASDKILDAIQKQEGYYPGSVSYRQNNPGNLKWSPRLAREFGATKGAGGHAIFPSYEVGRNALRQLIETKGRGQTLAQIGQWYAEGAQGGARWTAGVAKGAGVSPNYVPAPVSGGGASTTQGGGTPPSGVLAEAQKIATLGPAAVQRFMASKGYPQNYSWCGDFAATVLKQTGGTPPKGYSVASNWRNTPGYQEVSSPQPGDIAVRRGVRTGQTGSHVTFVEGVQRGTFTGLGGNQRRKQLGRSTYPTGRFQFYRPRAGRNQALNARGGTQTAGLGRGNIDINVKAPAGTKVARTGNGVFQDMNLTQSRQMAPNGWTPDDNYGYA